MDENIEELELELEAASKRCANAMAVLARKASPQEWENYELANADELALERRLSAAKGEPYAISADFSVAWDIGAPMPFLLASERKTFLAFYPRVHDPKKIREPDHPQPLRFSKGAGWTWLAGATGC